MTRKQLCANCHWFRPEPEASYGACLVNPPTDDGRPVTTADLTCSKWDADADTLWEMNANHRKRLAERAAKAARHLRETDK